MGAGASAEDKRELQACFAEFQRAGDDALSDEAFEDLMRRHAPLLYQKAEDEAGDPAAAARALRVQFRTAAEKMAARDAPPRPGVQDRLASAAAAKLRAAHPWAAAPPTNLQRGLVHGMLRSHALRLVDFAINGERVRALVDSGADRCGMSIEAADRCGLRGLIDASFSKTVAGMGTTQGLGRVHYVELELNGLTFRAGFDVMRWPDHAAEFESILGLDFLVRCRAMLDLGGSQVDLSNHDGASTTVDLVYPKEKDDLDRVQAAVAGQQAALKAREAAEAKAAQATDQKPAAVSVEEAFAANALKNAETRPS